MIPVSAVLPFRDEARWLPGALESMARQRLDGFEALLVDDGSSDGSAEIVREFCRRDSRFRLVASRGRGLVDALNTGLEEARGEWAARFDADDFSHPDRLSLQLDLARSLGARSVVSCLVRCFPREALSGGYLKYEAWLNSLVDHGDISREMFIESPVPHPGAFFHRIEVLRAGGYRDLGLPEDYELWLRLWSLGFRFGKVPRNLLAWRERPDRFSRRSSSYSLTAFYRTKAMYLDRVPFLRRKRVVIAGSGQTARRLSLWMIRGGFRVEAFIGSREVESGGLLRGIPVLGPDGLDDYPGIPVVAASREPGARERIRRYLTGRGLVEGKDFLVCA